MPRRSFLRSRRCLDVLAPVTHPHPDSSSPDIKDLNSKTTTEIVDHTPNLSHRRKGSNGSLLSVTSENSIRSSSSCSWNEDTDQECTEKIKNTLDAIDDFLYEDKQSDYLGNLDLDCLTWRRQFEHFRVKGEKLEIPIQNCPIQENAEDEVDCDINYIDGNSDIRAPSHDSENRFDTDSIKEIVLEKLLSHILPRFEEWQKATIVRPHCGSANHAGQRARRKFRPLTADENNWISLPFINNQPLEGILSVSSKVLQDRTPSAETISPLSRPSSSNVWLQDNCKTLLYRSQRRTICTVPTLSTIPNSEILSDLDFSKEKHKGLVQSSFARTPASSRLHSASSRPNTAEYKTREDAQTRRGTLPVLTVYQTSKLLSPRSSGNVKFN